MATLALADRLYTLEEYLDREDGAEFKSEYHAGYIFAMAGGTEAHSRLSMRMGIVLDRHLPGCRIYDSNLKLYIEQADRTLYPDAMALCAAEPQFLLGRKTVITNPTLVVEVLSPSSEQRNRGSKAEDYRSVSSIEHILLVSQDVWLVDHFERKSRDQWTVTRYQEPEAMFRLLGAEISVGEIYSGILE